jgi:hypothetical protein
MKIPMILSLQIMLAAIFLFIITFIHKFFEDLYGFYSGFISGLLELELLRGSSSCKGRGWWKSCKGRRNIKFY